jgi:hypothetical protein
MIPSHFSPFQFMGNIAVSSNAVDPEIFGIPAVIPVSVLSGDQVQQLWRLVTVLILFNFIRVIC